jgi:sterol desaturase/sphingolipid hydroxylase (fatty acid hydroxylase superfamily)
MIDDLIPGISTATLQGVYYLVYHLTAALTALIQRSSWLYWPYVASSLVLAAVVLHFQSSARADVARHLSRAVWWHPSARADYRLYLANALILPLVLAPWLPSVASACAALGSPGCLPAGANAAPAELQGTDSTAVALALRALWTLLFFVAYDFGRFLAHCLLHDCPALWPFHRLHHSAQVLTPITAFRAHPVELLIMAWGPLVTTTLMTLLFNRASGQPVEPFTFLGLHAVLAATNFIDNLRHSTVWVSYGNCVGRWLISPAHHQLHHSCEPRHLGCNRGFTLAIWDRLYGTLYVPAMQPEVFRLGLGDETEPEWHRLRHAWIEPFRESVALVLAWVRVRVRDAIRSQRADSPRKP